MIVDMSIDILMDMRVETYRLQKIGPVPANPETNQPGSSSLIFKPLNQQNALFNSI